MKKTVLIFLLICSYVYAAEIHVNGGSIQSVVDDAQPGDVVIVEAGMYNERVSTVRSGTQNQRITLQANGNARISGFNINHQYITLEGFEITGSLSEGIKIGENGNYCEILNNNIHDLTGNDPRAIETSFSSGPQNPRGCLIKGNHIHGNTFRIYIEFYASDFLIEENEIGPGRVVDGFRPFGDNNIIRNNDIHDNVNAGGHMDVFQIFNDNGWRVQNLIFEKNSVVSWEGQTWMVDCTSDSYGIIVRNNIFKNIYDAGQSYCPRNEIYNNIFDGTAHHNCHPVMIRSSSGRGDGSNSRIFNNIFYNGGCGGGNDGYYSVDSGAQPTFQADNNIVYPAKNGFSESNGISVDPQFVNPESNDYTLQASSAAIDAGADLSSIGFNDDHNSNSRPAGSAWDIGAFEYGATGSHECTEDDWSYSDGECQPDNTATRSWTKGNCSSGVEHPNTEIVNCNYTPPCVPMTTAELSVEIQRWKQGQISIEQLMEAIATWKNGC